MFCKPSQIPLIFSKPSHSLSSKPFNGVQGREETHRKGVSSGGEETPKVEKRLSLHWAASFDKQKKRTKKSMEAYKIYIFKVPKQFHPGIGISRKAMGIMNSFINDICKKLAWESSKLARHNKKPTIMSREILTAVSRAEEERDTMTPEENEIAKLSQQEEQSNPILSLVNVVGIVGSGVLGALYTLAQKEKIATEATIESLKNRLNENEAAMVSMEKKFKKQLFDEQEERSRQLKKAREDQLSLTNQLTSANSTISGLGRELLNEKRLLEELKAQIGTLDNNLVKARDDNKMLEAKLQEKFKSMEILQDRINLLTLEVNDKENSLVKLNSSLMEKESQCADLDFIHKRTKEDLTKANLEINSLNEELLKTRETLDSKIYTVEDLNNKITSLASERDAIQQKLQSLQGDYDNLKSSAENKAASDAELLRKRDSELEHLDEKLRNALNEVNIHKSLISDLTKERDETKRLLEVEVDNVKSLKHELGIAQEALKTSRTEASDFSKQLDQSKKSCQALTSEISRMQTVFAEARDSLKKRLQEAKSTSEALSAELVSVKKALEKTKEELRVVSDELAGETENRESLKKELVDVYKKVERMANELKEERNITASLSKELKAAEKQILKDREARQNLETDLEEATKSLDEVNKNVLMFSRELEIANSRIESLEGEKELLYKSLVEHKNIAKKAREDVEDAHSLIMKLGKERETLDNRGKKLEEELASAKGEILRLRTRINPPRSPVNDVHQQKSGNVEGNAAVAVKKTRRRKSSPPPAEESQ